MLRIDGDPYVERVSRGDVILLPRGDPHHISDAGKRAHATVRSGAPEHDAPAPEPARWLCGTFTIGDPQASHLLASLPAVIILRHADLATEQISRGVPAVSAGTLDAMAVTACIALARGDPAGAPARAAKLAEQAHSTGFVLWERAAQRIDATASAAPAETGPPDPCRFPALIYVDRP